MVDHRESSVSEAEDTTDPVSLNERLLKYARHGETDLIRALLSDTSASTRVDVNCRGQSKANKDWSPLHLASYFGHADIVQLLLEHGANVNAVNDFGDTALHKAAYTGRLDIVTLLLKHDADVFIVNAEGLSPKYVTRSSEIRDIVADVVIAPGFESGRIWSQQ